MREIQYRIGYNGFPPIIVKVQARNINAGFPKALKAARALSDREICSIEFWMIEYDTPASEDN